MNDTRKIKQLQSQLNIMLGDLEVLKIEIANKQRECNHKNTMIHSLKQSIESLKNNNNLKISEHAILRYLERVKGIDISEIEKEILTPEIISLVEKLGGNGKYPFGEFQLIIKDFTVTTIA